MSKPKPAPLPSGTVVGGYQVIKKLAAGGFGVVYRGRHRESGQPAAIKLLHPELVTNETVVRRFEREIEVLQRVRHPGIVEVLEVGRLPAGISHRVWIAAERAHGVG